MIENNIRNKFFILVLSLFVIFFCWSFYIVFFLNNASFYKENGMLENTQVLLLFVTFLIFLLPTLYQNRNDKLIFGFFSLLTLNFILRELDVPKLLILIGSGIGRKVLLAIGFVSILLYASFNYKYYANLSKELLQSRAGALIFISPVFLFLGGFFEEAQFQHNEYFEEISELIGYILLFFVALIFFNRSLGERV
jgi:uncharacterized membrane protein YhaH (DUF805 family)